MLLISISRHIDKNAEKKLLRRTFRHGRTTNVDVAMMMSIHRYFIAFICVVLITACIYVDAEEIEAEKLFKLAQQLFGGNHSAHGTAALPIVHIMRVPKASSSSLSMVARRVVGCNPPGPCCKWPGEPPGSCPAVGLNLCDKKVVGCMHHYPHYDSFKNKDIFSMTVLREPVSRAASAYGYGSAQSIHYNVRCKSTEEPYLCARQYIHSKMWSNIATKLLSGHYAYEDIAVCRFKNECKASLELALKNFQLLDFLGITELWQISLLVLHAKLRQFPPSYVEFVAAEKEKSSHSGIADAIGLRVSNRSHDSLLVTNPELREELRVRNEFDIELYAAAVARLCDDVHEYKLWDYDIVRSAWWRRTKLNVTNCMP